MGSNHERPDVHAMRFRLPRSRRAGSRLALPEVPTIGARAGPPANSQTVRPDGHACFQAAPTATAPDGCARSTARTCENGAARGADTEAQISTPTAWRNGPRSSCLRLS